MYAESLRGDLKSERIVKNDDKSEPKINKNYQPKSARNKKQQKTK